MNKKELGSKTAKGGFANEQAVCRKFNSWKKDKEAQEWLQVMGYNLDKIKSVQAIQIPIRIKKSDITKFGVEEDEYEKFIKYKKADAQLKICIRIGDILKIENLSLKKANRDADYNQIDKRTIDSYREMWGFDEEISYWLKLFTGELNPKEEMKKGNLKEQKNKRFKDTRRLFLDEIPSKMQNKIINFFKKNRIRVVSDIIKGRGGLSADWMLVAKYDKISNATTWVLKDINFVMNFLGNGKICISPKGSLYIGRITMQRKGGTPDPTKIQFKIKPCELFGSGA
ncbi:MAG TPA: type II restriction endonuclease [Candidatus Hydrogenedens sp.]|nr:type II restriction endonuclease [Candidatus Hydrogenedens sp.]